MESGSQSLALLPEMTQLPSAAVPEATYTPAPSSSLTVPPVMCSPTSATTPSSPASMYTVRRQQPRQMPRSLELEFASTVPGSASVSASITTVPACTASMCTDRVMCRAAPGLWYCTPTGPNVYVPAATMMWLTDVSATAAARPDTSLTSSGGDSEGLPVLASRRWNVSHGGRAGWLSSCDAEPAGWSQQRRRSSCLCGFRMLEQKWARARCRPIGMGRVVFTARFVFMQFLGASSAPTYTPNHRVWEADRCEFVGRRPCSAEVRGAVL